MLSITKNIIADLKMSENVIKIKTLLKNLHWGNLIQNIF